MTGRDANPTQGFGATGNQLDWNFESAYWRQNWNSRPYAAADRGYGYYEPGYRYGVESARQYRGRDWNDVEPELRSGWDRYEHRGNSTWDNIKDAVRDAWDRVANR
jgi:hypothetical protein